MFPKMTKKVKKNIWVEISISLVAFSAQNYSIRDILMRTVSFKTLIVVEIPINN